MQHSALHNVIMTDSAKRLKSAREAAGYRTGREFADKNGIAQSTYSTQEAGTRGIPAETAEQYADLLDVSPSWLLFGKEHIVVSVFHFLNAYGYHNETYHVVSIVIPCEKLS